MGDMGCMRGVNYCGVLWSVGCMRGVNYCGVLYSEVILRCVAKVALLRYHC